MKWPPELQVEAQKPVFNTLILISSVLVTLIGLSGIIGYLFNLPWLRSYLLDNVGGHMALLTAMGITSLGVGIPVILDSRPYEATSWWLWPVRSISLLIPGGIGLYGLIANFQNPAFDVLDINTYGLTQFPFLTAAMLFWATVALGIFLFWKHNETAVAYFVCIPALMCLSMGILILLGYGYQIPLLYSFRMALPTALAAILTGIILLIGTLPYRGLLLPVLSTVPKARLMAYLSLGLGFGVLLFGLNSIALSLRYNNILDTTMLSVDMRHLYTVSMMETTVVAILIKILGLRATRYFSESVYYAQQQQEAATQETTIRQVIQAVHSSLDLEESFKKIATSLGIFLQADRCFISSYNQHQRRLSPPTQEYLFSEEIQSMLTADASLWQAFNAFAEALCHEVHPVNFDEGKGLSPEMQEHLGHIAVQSGIGCAVLYRGQCQAVLFIHQVRYKRAWTDSEMKIIQTVAEQAGVAIYQAELFRQKAIAEERFKLFTEGVTDYAIYLADIEGKITSWNQGAERIFRYQTEEILDHPFSTFLPPEEIEAGLGERELTLAHTEGRFETEGWRVRKDGSQFWASILITALYNSQGQVIGFSNITRDITDRKLAESALLEYQKKLANSNRDLEYFATVASHDLQAPLRKVQFFCEQIYQEAKDKLSPEALDLMQRAHRSVTMAQQLVTDLLALSKVTKTGQPFSQVNLASIMNRVLINLAEPIKSTQAQIDVDLPGSMMGDPMQLEQLLQNLVENSLKYQPPGQKPIIKAYSDCADSTFYQVIVEDNGIGIDPRYTERIFQPFERLHGKASPYPGTGVGLAICKRIVERHGGTITVESTLGHGAKFIVCLPYKPVEKALGSSPRSANDEELVRADA